MFNTRGSRTVILLAFAIIAITISVARSDDKPKPAANPDQAKMMEDMMKMAQPGPEHDLLKKFAGEWDAACKFWNLDGSDGGASKGIMHAKMILGDRYLQLNYEGEMDMPNGKMPFKGMGIGGFDRGKKKYVNFWIDEMSTGAMITEGTCDGKVLTCEGTATDPMSGQPMKVKEVITDIDNDHHKYELWMNNLEGKMMKMMEIMYTRRT
jgi:hypothetical protein